jgi:AraC-like DNA-binding protein
VREDGDVALAYQELAPPAGLGAHVACLWLSHDGAVRVLPDACVDVVLDAGRLVVAGPATTARWAPASPGQARVGLRFRVASAGAALGVPASELLDRDVPLAELWGRAGRRLEDEVARAPAPGAALAALARGVAARLPAADGRDAIVRQAAVAVVGQGLPVHEAARHVGLSERQLRRRFERAVGYGPATLVRVQRFQRFLALAQRNPEAALARLALDAGYADQAHLTRECRRLAGLSAAALLAGGPTAAGDKSVSFKPSARAAETLPA